MRIKPMTYSDYPRTWDGGVGSKSGITHCHSPLFNVKSIDELIIQSYTDFSLKREVFNGNHYDR
jgi:hypothetical protein